MWMVFKAVNQDGGLQKSECGKGRGSKEEPEKEPGKERAVTM